MARTKASVRAAEQAAERALKARDTLPTKAARKQAAPPFCAKKTQARKSTTGTNGKGKKSNVRYVVCSLDEWVPDGFHSYQGPGDYEVHGAYTTLAAAKKAARNIFYKKNPWGLSPEEIEQEDIDEEEAGAGLRLCVHPADSTRWSVTVKLMGDVEEDEEDEDEGDC